MKFAKENLNLEKAIDKEWIITNGIGGFASSTIIGANTRKYHGLLVAPIIPPARRTLILSKLDESVEVDGRKYDLFTNIGASYISQGFKYQESFEKEYMPKFTYKVEDIEITKTICMLYGKNTVGVYYKIKNGNQYSKLTLAPIMNYRDVHGMSHNHYFEIEQQINDKKIEMKIDGGNPIYMNISDGKYIKHENDVFGGMFYIEEQKRGFEPVENHVVPGRYEISVEPGEEKHISFICSLDKDIDELDARTIIIREKARMTKIINAARFVKNEDDENKQEVLKTLLVASDSFIIKRPEFDSYSMIAGYPWFLDWMRDTLISFEGIFLITKRFSIAKEILKSAVRDIKCGLVPNTYNEFDHTPLYNSVDSSLLLFEQVKKYLDYTSDYNFIMKEIYPKLEEIILNYTKGIDLDDNNIYLDTDGLIVSGTEYTQNTWMDAKFAGIAVTPRNGKPVEINAMWYNALKIMQELANKNKEKDKVKKYQRMATKCKSAFESKFYNKKRKCLYDVIGDGKIRPNQLFALSLTYSILEPNSEEAKEVFETVTKKLLNNYGLKTLAKGEENYVEIYEGDGARRDFSYHQGITWTWLLGLYYDSLKKIVDSCKKKTEKEKYENRLKEFVDDVTKTFSQEIFERGCIGSIAEIYDSKKPHLPKGACAQAWSVAEVLRIILCI